MMERSLRFCMVTTFYPPYNFGGDGIFVHRLANHLAAQGHRVDVVHCLDAYRFCARRHTQQVYEDHPNVTIHGLESPFGFLSPLATHQTGFPLFKSGSLRRIMEKGFDVIHYHNISLVGGPRILEYGRGIKLYTAHEYWLFCPAHLFYTWKQTRCPEPGWCALCGLLQGVPPQWWRCLGLMKRYVTNLDAVITPSNFCREIYRRHIPHIPIVHLPNFVSREKKEVKGRPDWNRDQPFFLFVGRLERIKGLQTVIPLIQKYGKARLLIAGEGGYGKELRQIAAGCDNIRFLGQLSSLQLRTLYRQAVALIVPSLCYEIFGTVIVEAFSEGTPAIVRGQGGMPELIRESGGGYVYETDEELVAAMDSLLHDEEQRRRLGNAAYSCWRERWTAEKHLERYLKLIADVAANRRTS